MPSKRNTCVKKFVSVATQTDNDIGKSEDSVNPITMLAKAATSYERVRTYKKIYTPHSNTSTRTSRKHGNTPKYIFKTRNRNVNLPFSVISLERMPGGRRKRCFSTVEEAMASSLYMSIIEWEEAHSKK